MTFYFWIRANNKNKQTCNLGYIEATKQTTNEITIDRDIGPNLDTTQCHNRPNYRNPEELHVHHSIDSPWVETLPTIQCFFSGCREVLTALGVESAPHITCSNRTLRSTSRMEMWTRLGQLDEISSNERIRQSYSHKNRRHRTILYKPIQHLTVECEMYLRGRQKGRSLSTQMEEVWWLPSLPCTLNQPQRHGTLVLVDFDPGDGKPRVWTIPPCAIRSSEMVQHHVLSHNQYSLQMYSEAKLHPSQERALALFTTW